MLPTTLLEESGAKKLHFAKDVFLFNEGSEASFYWQVMDGSIKMANYSKDGQEFTQGIFKAGESFGEPPLFSGFPYPSNAVAVTESFVWKLSKDKFFEILAHNFELHLQFTRSLSERLHYKAMIMKEISSHDPEHRILTLIDYLKEKESSPYGYYEVPFTRQQIADMTGLRVETVIRSIKSLEQKGKVSIQRRKVYRKV
ncbi:Crp/Fnr family transcriptional regulator [Nafulsella turpanensis]|uniref:Crp/Fnr family transcriptional regulator n=1 Tax=Nafulsella turpanensis TaxID=1265690 RepID=UPI00034C5765|nr:Crp/Fnr family transcriptional regulator [Nafulsella turpanensis]